MPLGTFRRMKRSDGLVHIDTSALLSKDRGEFAANVYLRTGGRGNLHIYPASQYSLLNLPKLHALTQLCADGNVEGSQESIRRSLPVQRTLSLGDGDLVLLNTGRFHQVDRFEEEGGAGGGGCAKSARLSGQCWLSYRRGRPLQMWV